VIAILLALAAWRLRDELFCSVCLAGAIFVTGAASAQLSLYFFPRGQIGLFAAARPVLADLEMRIVEPPRVSGGEAEMRKLPPKQTAVADVTGVETPAGWQRASGRITVSLEPPLDALAAGQTIRALGFLDRPEAPQNPGEFDMAAYDRLQRVLVGFRVRRSDTVQILRDDGPPPLVRLRQKARSLLAEGFDFSHERDAAFLRMMLLGDPDPLVNDVREEFDLTGTAYQLSISGLHIGILAGFVLLTMRLGRRAPEKAVWLAMAVVALYAAVALPSQAGVRALLACGLVSAALLGRRSTDGLQVLAVAILIILLILPTDLYDAGFQIGVVAVLGLLLLARPVEGFFIGLRKSDDPPGAPAREHGPMLTMVLGVAKAAWRALLASAVIWVAVLPLLIYHFQQASPWAVPGGLMLLPLTIVTLLSGAAKIILTLICPWKAAWWAAGAAVPAGLLRDAVWKLSNLPAAGLATAVPPAWVFVVYYALLLLPRIPWRSSPARWMARLAFVPACAFLLALPAPAVAEAVAPHGGVRVTLLSIGAGQTALVRVHGGETFFVDCGSNTVTDVYQRAIHPYLLYEGVRRVDDIFLSHGDYDHISAAAEIIHAYGVPAVHMTPHFRRHAEGNFAAEALLQLLDSRGPPPSLLAEGDQVNIGGGANLRVLWPPVKCNMDSNNCGMVMKLNYAGKSILFTADIQVPPELELLKHPGVLKADVLVAPHHGSAESSTPAFLRAVNPRMIVCSNDSALTHKQMVFDKIAGRWPVYRTSRCGTIDVTVAADGQIGVETFTGAGAIAGSGDNRVSLDLDLGIGVNESGDLNDRGGRADVAEDFAVNLGDLLPF
jgi:competence protein ComEC